MAIRDHQRIKGLEAQLAKYQADTVIEHNLTFVERKSYGDYAFRSDEEAAGMFRPCQADRENGLDVDGIIMPGLKGGWIADHAIWEERGTCKSILRSDLGIWWNDRQFNFRRASNARP